MVENPWFNITKKKEKKKEKPEASIKANLTIIECHNVSNRTSHTRHKVSNRTRYEAIIKVMSFNSKMC